MVLKAIGKIFHGKKGHGKMSLNGKNVHGNNVQCPLGDAVSRMTNAMQMTKLFNNINIQVVITEETKILGGGGSTLWVLG